MRGFERALSAGAIAVLELTAERFRIRINGVGEPVEIQFAPAKGE